MKCVVVLQFPYQIDPEDWFEYWEKQNWYDFNLQRTIVASFCGIMKIQNNIKYKWMVSDGDSKAFNTVENEGQHSWYRMTQSYFRDPLVGPLKTQMSVLTLWFGYVAQSISIMALRLFVMLLPQLYATSTKEQNVERSSWITFQILVKLAQAMPLG